MRRRYRSLRENLGSGYKLYVPSKGYATMHEFDYEQGEGNYVNEWDIDVKGTYNSVQELIKKISRDYGCVSENIKHWGYSVDSGTMGSNTLVDEEAETVSEREIEDWKNGEMELYLCDVYIPVQIISSPRDLTEEEAEQLGLEIW